MTTRELHDYLKLTGTGDDKLEVLKACSPDSDASEGVALLEKAAKDNPRFLGTLEKAKEKVPVKPPEPAEPPEPAVKEKPVAVEKPHKSHHTAHAEKKA